MRDEWEIAHLGELMAQRTDFTPIDRASTYPVVGVQRSGWGLIDREPPAGGTCRATTWHVSTSRCSSRTTS